MMSTRNGYIDLPFIVSTDRHKADSETRKLIRSHVMRGKNRVKPRKKPRNPAHESKPKSKLSKTDDFVWSLNVSTPLCSSFSAVRFAGAVEPELVADVLSFLHMSSSAMFMLDQCLVPEASEMSFAWFEPMFFDAAYLYTACFTIQTYFDGLLSRTRSLEAQRRDHIYYAKSIKILQDRLAHDDDSSRLSDSTIMTILALSGHAYTMGDYQSANYHIGGLLKLVSMRGVTTFLHNTRLLIEIIRCDLVTAVDTGSKPVLFTPNDILWPLILTSKSVKMANESGVPNQFQSNKNNLLRRLDPELASVWAAMSGFCGLINSAAESGGVKMAEEAFLHSMGSIMYRLLLQRFEIGSLNEAFRLGLLAFSSPIFLHWNRVELPDLQFTSAYRKALCELKVMEANVKPCELLWLLMVGALSMSHEPDGFAWIKSRLQVNMELYGALTWEDMRETLDSFLWIGILYDEPGLDVFNSMRLKDTEVKRTVNYVVK